MCLQFVLHSRNINLFTFLKFQNLNIYCRTLNPTLDIAYLVFSRYTFNVRCFQFTLYTSVHSGFTAIQTLFDRLANLALCARWKGLKGNVSNLEVPSLHLLLPEITLVKSL